MTNEVVNFAEGIEFGNAQKYKNMTVLPLIAAWPPGPEYITLGQARKAGVLAIKEVSEHGSVPQLRVENSSDRPVLLLDGEELIGAKQNRVVNTTILLKEKSVTVIPVSCTEQGRWSYRSREFSDSNIVMSPRLRTAKSRSVSDSLKSRKRYDSDQGEIWDEIRQLSDDAEVHSPTGAMRDVFKARQGSLRRFLETFTPQSGQTGLLVIINGLIVGFDILSRSEAYEQLAPKLVRSYAMEAILNPDDPIDMDAPRAAKEFFGVASQAEVSPYESVGYGKDYRFSGRGLVGSALLVDDNVIHMAFFVNRGSSESESMSDVCRRRGFRDRYEDN